MGREFASRDAIARPLEQDPAILFDCQYVHLRRCAVHRVDTQVDPDERILALLLVTSLCYLFN